LNITGQVRLTAIFRIEYTIEKLINQKGVKMKKFYIFVILLVLLASCAPSEQEIQETVQAAIKQTELANPTATKTRLPSYTPRPTKTPAPTNTPKPTATKTPLPEPITLEGTGDQVLDIEKSWDGPSILEIENNGSSNFVVKNYDTYGNYLDLLVNEIGRYNGKLLMDLRNNENTSRFEVKSSGTWTIKVMPFDPQYLETFKIPGTYEGLGDNILILEGKPDIGLFSTTERENFAVWIYYGNTRDLIINEIGPYSGQAVIQSDAFLMEIHCAGSWVIEITSN
jgi:hypothetical protein